LTPQSTENTFKELLQLSRGDLTEITSKLKQLTQGESDQDQLRKEIIDQGRKMNELRAEHEQQIYE
jgi:phage-related protein